MANLIAGFENKQKDQHVNVNFLYTNKNEEHAQCIFLQNTELVNIIIPATYKKLNRFHKSVRNNKKKLFIKYLKNKTPILNNPNRKFYEVSKTFMGISSCNNNRLPWYSN